MSADLAPKFKAIGLADATVAETLRNAKLCALLSELIDLAGAAGGIEKAVGSLLYSVATKVPPELGEHRKMLVEYVRDKKLKSNLQLEAAVKYLDNMRIRGSDFVKSDFESAAGIGVVVTPADIEAAVRTALATHDADIKTAGWAFAGRLIAAVNALLKWADGSLVKAEVDKQLTAAIGPRVAGTPSPAAADRPKKVRVYVYLCMIRCLLSLSLVYVTAALCTVCLFVVCIFCVCMLYNDLTRVITGTRRQCRQAVPQAGPSGRQCIALAGQLRHG